MRPLVSNVLPPASILLTTNRYSWIRRTTLEFGSAALSSSVSGSRTRRGLTRTVWRLVSPTNNAASHIHGHDQNQQPPTFSQNPIVQIEGGVLEGLFLGFIPFGAVAEQVLTGTGALPRGTVAFERGLALGQIVTGLAEIAGGAGGSVVGGLMSATGIGATLGVPAIAVSAVVVTGGAANVAAGLAGLMSSGSGPSTPRQPAQGAAPAATGGPTSFDAVAAHVAKTGKLPNNFITKAEAKSLGWNPKAGNLADIAPGKSIGGDIFGNNEGLLPNAPGRIWFEADINYRSGVRGADRLLYSSDGLIFKTIDHYKTFTQIR